MSIQVPERRKAMKPIGRLRSGAFGGGKKSMHIALNLTPMVDMFTRLVVFLLQNCSASGDILVMQKDMKLPEVDNSEVMDIGPVVTITKEKILLQGKPVAETPPLMVDGNQEITPLREGLAKIIELDERLRRKTRDINTPFDGKLFIQADQKQEFKVMKKVIYSANAAGWFHLNFAVVGAGGKEVEGEGAAAEGAAQ